MASIQTITYPAAAEPLRGLLPDWVLDSTSTQVRVPDRYAVGWEAPSAGSSTLVKIGSNPEPGVIVLHPSYYQPGTATGEALRAHELFHIQQRGEIPDFAKKFADAAQLTHDRGLKPWENPYEIPAYQFEEDVKAYLLAQGYPE